MGPSYSEVLGYAVSFDPKLNYPTVWRYSEVLKAVTCTGYTGIILVHGVTVMFSSLSTVHGSRYKGCQICSTGRVQHFSHGVWRYSEVLISVTCTGYTGIILVHGVTVMFSSISTAHGSRYKGCQICSTGQEQHFSHGVRSRIGAYSHYFNFVDVPHVSCERYIHLGS